MLGPVHVGSGQMLGPMDYVVRQEKDGVIWFYAIDAGRILARMTDRQRIDLESATRGGGLSAGLRRFIVSNFDPAKHALWQCQADETLLRASQVGQAPAGGRRDGGRRGGPGGPGAWAVGRVVLAALDAWAAGWAAEAVARIAASGSARRFRRAC